MKRVEQNNCARYCQIRKCDFLILKKRMSKKTVLGILRFVSMLFDLIIFNAKGVMVVFIICMYAFFEYCYF